MNLANKGQKIAVTFIPIGVGAAFAGGILQSAPLLNYLPPVVHIIVGYGLIVVGIIGLYHSVK